MIHECVDNSGLIAILAIAVGWVIGFIPPFLELRRRAKAHQ